MFINFWGGLATFSKIYEINKKQKTQTKKNGCAGAFESIVIGISFTIAYFILFIIMIKFENYLVTNYNAYWLCAIIQVLILTIWIIINRKNKNPFNSKFDLQKSVDSCLLSIDNMTSKGIEFEKLCANILIANGYCNVQTTKASGDFGADILATKNGLTYAIQCKCYSKPVSNKAVQEVYTAKAYYNCTIAVVLTNNYFTQSAKDTARATNVFLWDRNTLKELLYSYCQKNQKQFLPSNNFQNPQINKKQKNSPTNFTLINSEQQKRRSTSDNYSWDNYYSKPSSDDNHNNSHWVIDTNNKQKNIPSSQPLEENVKKEIEHLDKVNKQLDEIERQIAGFRKTLNVHSENFDITTDDDDIVDDFFENIEFDNISENTLDNLSDDKTYNNDSISQNILRLINENIDDIDPMFENAVEIVVEKHFASTSLLQRKLQINYARAGRIIDFLEMVNIISSHNSTKYREVLISKEQWINNIKPYLPKIESHYTPIINNDSVISSYDQQIIDNINNSDKSEDNSFDEWFNEIIRKAPYSYVVINGKTELSQKGKIYNDPTLRKTAKAVYEGKDISSTYIQYYFKTSEKKANQIMNALKDLKILK